MTRARTWSANRRPTRSRRSTRSGLKADIHDVNSDEADRAPSPASIPKAGHAAAQGREGADQRLAGPEAGRRAAGRRLAVRVGRGRRSRAPASRSRGATSIRTSRRASSSRWTRAANSLIAPGSTVTLFVSKGPTDVVRPGRDELLARGRDRDAAELRLQGRRRRLGHRRPVPGRRRHDADAGARARRRSPGRRHDHGRPLHRAADRRATTTDATTPTDTVHDSEATATGRADTAVGHHVHARQTPARRRPDGRPFLGAPDLARVRAVGDRRARPGALRRRRDRDRPRRPLVARLRPGQNRDPSRCGQGRASDTPDLSSTAARSGHVERGRGHARRGRGRAADPARAVRGGRAAPGAARDGGRRRTSAPTHAASALCMDKDLFKAVMRDQGIPVTRNITLRGRRGSAREPVRLSRLRQAGAARLVGRDHEGARRRRAPRRGRARVRARREGARRGVRLRDRGRGRRAR